MELYKYMLDRLLLIGIDNLFNNRNRHFILIISMGWTIGQKFHSSELGFTKSLSVLFIMCMIMLTTRKMNSKL